MPVTRFRSPINTLRYLAFALVLSFFAAASFAAEASHRILLLGDSLSAAYGVPQDEAWTTLLAEHLPSHAQLHNASVSGETTSGGLQRLPALLNTVKPTLVIIELGGNDGLRGYPLDNIRVNLEQLIKLSQDKGADILLVGMQIPPNYGKRYSQGFAQLYPDLATAHSLPLIPFLLENIATRPELMQVDRIHPNAKAQNLIVQNVLPTLLGLLD